MTSNRLFDEFLSGRVRAVQTLAALKNDLLKMKGNRTCIDSTRLYTREDTYALSRQSDTLVCIGQLREWANSLAEQLSGR